MGWGGNTREVMIIGWFQVGPHGMKRDYVAGVV